MSNLSRGGKASLVAGIILTLVGVISMALTVTGHRSTWEGLPLAISGVFLTAVCVWAGTALPSESESMTDLDKKEELAKMKEKIDALDLRERFCEDCGQALVMWSAQRGFDTATGKPAMESVFACPGWDSKNNYSFAQHSQQRTCGKSVVTSYTIAFTHGHEVLQPSVLCKACLVEMYRDNIIDSVAYASLMEKAS